ncbi:hypothetical protein [Rossellomorea sp. YZS02]|uniref:hypothetical protein n=1 Tax=Rossellomorea sp. YZS02 TaxID=3097358 RepID=UPI002A13CDAA|nr:hypothetical protein [Rossellomorea sp. YZS02]MDX8344151.1 hypothetical protein [Rossellomorea sp. YZS02]
MEKIKGTIAKDKLIFLFLPISIRILMDVILIRYISTKWGYQGFILDINHYKLSFSYLTLLIMLFLLTNYNREKFSHFLTIVIFFTIYMPIGSIYGLMDKSTAFFVMASISFIFIIFFILYIDSKQKKSLILVNENLYFKGYPIIFIISIYTLFAMTVQNIGHLNFGAVISLVNVYDVRELISYNWGMNYLFSWQTKVINPYMIALSHINNKRGMMWFYIGFQLWLFILTGNKMVLFTLIVVLIIFKFSSKLRNLHLFFTQGLTFTFIISFLEATLLYNSYIIDIFIRRVIYLPALLSYYYYEYFSVEGFQYWSYTMFGRILGVSTDFNVVPSFIIGREYFNDVNTNAVTGYLGSEYMNGGFIGILLATFIIILLFKSFDRFSGRLGNEIVLITLLTPIYALWNTAILTALLTGGILIAFIILSQTKRIEY